MFFYLKNDQILRIRKWNRVLILIGYMLRIMSSKMPKWHDNHILSIPTGVLHLFDCKPGSSKFYIALKSSSFSFIFFLLFAALKSGITITSPDHIYFSQPESFGSLGILIPRSTEISPNAYCVSMNLKLDYPLFIMGPNLAGLERLGCMLHTGNPPTTPII